MTLSLRERFARGDAVTGIIGFIGAPMTIEIFARAGIDFVDADARSLDAFCTKHRAS